MARQEGRLGILRRIEGRVTAGDTDAVTLSGEGTGFTGWDVSIQGTSEDIPGGGSLRSRDTRHTTGTASYGVDHIGAARVLWDKHAHVATYLWQENAAAPVQRYYGYDSVSVTFAQGGAISYSVDVTLSEAPQL